MRGGAAVAGDEDGGGTLETALGIPLRSVGWGGVHTAQSVMSYFFVFYCLIESCVKFEIYRLMSVAACLLSTLLHIILFIKIIHGLSDYRLDMEKMC